MAELSDREALIGLCEKHSPRVTQRLICLQRLAVSPFVLPLRLLLAHGKETASTRHTTGRAVRFVPQSSRHANRKDASPARVSSVN